MYSCKYKQSQSQTIYTQTHSASDSFKLYTQTHSASVCMYVCMYVLTKTRVSKATFSTITRSEVYCTKLKIGQ